MIGPARGLVASVRAALDETLPRGVSTSVLVGSEPADELLPAESEAIEGSARGRVEEFRRGRTCARRALATLGLQGFSVARGAKREPIWPEGIVGSITHCDGYCAAAVARSDRLRLLGIDAERIERLHLELAGHICVPGELESLARSMEARQALALLFSAKESVYKALFPLCRRWIGFHDVRLGFDLERGRFRVFRVVPDEVAIAPRLEGRFVVRGGFVLTAAFARAAIRRRRHAQRSSLWAASFQHQDGRGPDKRTPPT
jgi:4'-phosphopantetheinyl transferase EntD